MALWAETRADFTDACMRCQIALEGRGNLSHGKYLEDWQVRALAKAQSAGGDVNGALEWIKPLSLVKRAEALTELAEGMASRTEKHGMPKERD